jgi:GABA(A) receptor-associated protein
LSEKKGMPTSTAEAKYMTERSLEQRMDESRKILARYRDRLPVICELHHNCKSLPEIDKRKFLVPRDLQVCQFLYVIRKRLSISSAQAIFLMTAKGSLPLSSQTIGSLYSTEHDLDGFLYIFYTGENTFG